MHLRLAREKSRMTDENSAKLTTLYEKFYQLLDAKKYSTAGELQSGISTILEFRNVINSTSTWPWETATIRGFFSALFIPIGIWLRQQILERLVMF